MHGHCGDTQAIAKPGVLTNIVLWHPQQMGRWHQCKQPSVYVHDCRNALYADVREGHMVVTNTHTLEAKHYMLPRHSAEHQANKKQWWAQPIELSPELQKAGRLAQTVACA